MIILDTTTRTLEVVLGGAITTNQLPVVTSYVDVTTTTYTPASANAATNSTTAVTMIAAPAASTQRQVKFVSIYNADTVAAIVTVRYNDNSTLRKIVVVTLQVGETLLYTDGEGWRVLDVTGAVKTAAVQSGVAGGDLAGTYPNPTIKSGVNLTGQIQADASFGAITADADGATITFNLATSSKHSVTLGGNRTLALSNGQTGQEFILTLVQDGTGSRTVTWWSGIKWPGGTVPTLTTTAAKADVFGFIQTGAGAYLGFILGQNL